MRKNYLFVKILIIFIVLVLALLAFYKLNSKPLPSFLSFLGETENKSSDKRPDCFFEIRDARAQLLNSGQEDARYEIKGFLRGGARNYLNSIISKIYLDKDKKTLIAEGYFSINRWVVINEGAPFDISASIKASDQLMKEISEKNIPLIVDTYPWFTTCR